MIETRIMYLKEKRQLLKNRRNKKLETNSAIVQEST
jgi:hypothetical protein